jgi:hypothetical protein
MWALLLFLLIWPVVLPAQVSTGATRATRFSAAPITSPTATDPTAAQMVLTPTDDRPGPAVQLVDAMPHTVTLRWTGVPGASGYLVFRNDVGRVTPTPLPSGSTSFTHTALNDYRVTYQYRVVAVYPDDHTGPSGWVPFVPPTPLNPAHFNAAVDRTGVTLSWDAVPGVEKYMLGGSGLGVEVVPVPGNKTSYPVTNLPPGRHTWVIGSYYPGPISTPAADWKTTTATVSPVTPADFRVETYGGGTILDFRWTPVSADYSYQLVRADAPDGPYAEPAGLSYAGSPRQWSRDSKVEVGKTYYYKLRAFFPGYPAVDSPALQVAVAPHLPGVSNLTATSPGPGRVVLSWAPAANAQSYSILRGKGNEPMAFIARDFTGTRYEDGNLYTGATYRYNVIPIYGYNRAGESNTLYARLTSINVNAGQWFNSSAQAPEK